MPKLLIIESCQVNYGDDRGGVHEDAGSVVDVSKDTAAALLRAGRALYTEKGDDPDKGGRNTADAAMLAAAAKMRAAAAKTRAAVEGAKPAADGNKPADTNA